MMLIIRWLVTAMLASLPLMAVAVEQPEGTRHHDLAAAMKAFETGGVKGESACIAMLIRASSDEGLTGFANDPVKQAHWRSRQADLGQ